MILNIIGFILFGVCILYIVYNSDKIFDQEDRREEIIKKKVEEIINPPKRGRGRPKKN